MIVIVNDLIHDTLYKITNENTKQHIQAHVKIQPENGCIKCECIYLYKIYIARYSQTSVL